VAIDIATTLFMLFKVAIERGSTNAESAGNLSLRNTSAHPLLCLGKLLISQRFRATLINPAGFRPGNPLRLSLTNNRTLKLRHRAKQAEHELGNRRGIQRIRLTFF